MKAMFFIALWLGIPLLGVLWGYFTYRRIVKMWKHDQILFAFCAARDVIALKAVQGEVSEDSELFNFFYSLNAQLIHHNREFGVCFKELAQALTSGRYNGTISSSTEELMRQLRDGDTEIKLMAYRYSTAVLAMLAENSNSLLLRAFLRFSRSRLATLNKKLNSFAKGVSRLMIPREEWETIRFARRMINASESSAKMTTVPLGACS